MKKLVVALLTVVLMMGLVACADNSTVPEPEVTDQVVDEPVDKVEDEPVVDDAAEIKIAVLLKPLSNEYWSSMKAGVESWAQENNYVVDVYAADSEENIAGQLSLMETILSKDYNAICAAPLSAANLVEGVAMATQKGVYIVNVDETIDHDAVRAAGGTMVGQFTTDNIKVGESAGKFIAETIGEGKVAIVEGTAGNVTSQNRTKGATDYLNAQDGLEVVSSQPGNWDRLVALDVATNVMQTYPDLKAFYCANDTMALGVYEAVKNANKTDQIIVVGTDAVTGAVESVSNGEMTATVGQDNIGIGIACVELAIKAVKENYAFDTSADIPIYYIDSFLVTKDNAAEILSQR